ncbi:MAG: GNAT family N-acetyltransferase [Candidatus Lokiarchaeota archaeon]|nr:GNAT family N-acetyltransferase [Candidatus Lokiarchaeota archaeon]
MSEDVTIRWYRENDYAAVEELVRNLARLFDDPFDSRWFKMYMEKRLMENVPGCYVAVKPGGEVIGSVFCDILRDPTGSQYGYISNIMIRKDFRGMGVGDKLLAAAMQYLTIAGVPRIWGNVREQTEAMVHLFQKHQFVRKFATFECRPPPLGI